MKLVKYSFYVAGRNNPNPDPERAVLPTIIYASKDDGIAKASTISVGWWAWGFGIIRTVVNDNSRSN